MRALWLKNLKKFATGTTNSSKQCLDVNIASTTASLSLGSTAYKERRFHLPATTGVNARSGAWVQLDANSDVAGSTPANVANTCTEMEVNWNGGAALEFGVGANSGAVTVIGSAGAGQTKKFGVSLASGDKVWVRAIQNSAVATGELLVVLLG